MRPAKSSQRATPARDKAPERGGYRQLGCATRAEATDRFVTFLEEAANGTDLGNEAFHAWPQVRRPFPTPRTIR